MTRCPAISVVGPGSAGPELEVRAFAVGRKIASAGAVLVRWELDPARTGCPAVQRAGDPLEAVRLALRAVAAAGGGSDLEPALR